MYQALAKLLSPQCVPYTSANPYEVFDRMMSDGKDNWGRHVMFVDWLARTFRERVGQLIWFHIRTRETVQHQINHEGPESQI